MESLGNPKTFAEAMSHLSENDPKLAKIIKTHGQIRVYAGGCDVRVPGRIYLGTAARLCGSQCHYQES